MNCPACKERDNDTKLRVIVKLGIPTHTGGDPKLVCCERCRALYRADLAATGLNLKRVSGRPADANEREWYRRIAEKGMHVYKIQRQCPTLADYHAQRVETAQPQLSATT